MSPPPPPASEVPILLLKSPSPTPPTDPYTTHLTTTTPSPSSPSTFSYTPHFIPVLTHTLLPDPLITLLTTHLDPNNKSSPFPYGALILTSQRAVAAFTAAVASPPLRPCLTALASLQLILYVVGPATATSILSIRNKYLPLCAIHGGEKAGSGYALTGIILGHSGDMDDSAAYTTTSSEYNTTGKPKKKPILFLTGEKRRDIIPTTLSSPSLPEEDRIQVDEMIVYSTTELEEFEFSFARVLKQTEAGAVRWVVVFSPTAGRGMLRALGWLGGRIYGGEGEGRKTFVACIGQTTMEYLNLEFGFTPDVVAWKPSPQGVREGIERFMRERGLDPSP